MTLEVKIKWHWNSYVVEADAAHVKPVTFAKDVVLLGVSAVAVSNVPTPPPAALHEPQDGVAAAPAETRHCPD
jgi:hypothetical protein